MGDPEPAEPRWSNADDPTWTAEVDEAPWQSRLNQKGEPVDRVKVLSCPVCKPHEIAIVYDEMAAEGLRDRDETKPAVDAECECGFVHVGAPPQAKGCGRVGWIRSPKQWKPKPDG